MGNDSASVEDGPNSPSRNNGLRNVGSNEFQTDGGGLGSAFVFDLGQTRSPIKGIRSGELITCSSDVSKEVMSNKDNKKMSLTSGLITVPIKWGDNVEAVQNSKRRNGMKLRSSKNCFSMSWNLEEEILKVIDYGIAVGYDFKDKEVKMVDIVA